MGNIALVNDPANEGFRAFSLPSLSGSPQVPRSRRIELAEGGAYGARMAAYLHLTAAPTLTVATKRRSHLAVTRLVGKNGLTARSAPVPTEEAFVVTLHLREVHDQELWLAGRLWSKHSYQVGGVSILDLENGPLALRSSPFDYLQFYVPRAALDEIADDSGARRIEALSWVDGRVDHVLGQMGTALLPALERPDHACRLFVDHILFALHAHFARTYGGMSTDRPPVRGGLATWQFRRATEMLMAHLDGDICLSQVAQECRLSMSHFVRAFRQTTGQPPYRWLVGRRIEVAKGLMLRSALPLAEIALQCGFADQACFIRAFKRMASETPGEWRRTRRS